MTTTPASAAAALEQVQGEQAWAVIRLRDSDTVTVLEGQLRSPEDDPFHCPANAAMVVFYGPSAIRAVRLHGSPEQPVAR